jgi:VWFA-related protein
MKFSNLLRASIIGNVVLFATTLFAQTVPPSQTGRVPAGSNGQASQTAIPSFKSASNLVLVDVVVTHNGQPVKGLQKETFHVIESGREQAIKVFEEHTSEETSQIQRQPLPPATYSNFPDSTIATSANVLLLDALNTPMENQLYIRQQLIAYLKKIPPGTRIAIFTLASRLRFVQGFTSDISSLLAVLNDPKNTASHSVLLDDTNNLINSSFDAVLDPSAATESILKFEADVTTFQTDVRVRITLDALKQLAYSLDGFPGRKNLIWISGSFPIDLSSNPALNNPFWTQRNYAAQLQQVDDLLAAGRIAVYPVDARGLIPDSSYAATSTSKDTALSDALDPGHAIVGTSMGHYPSPSGKIGEQGRAIPAGSIGQFSRQTTAEHGTMQQIAEQSGGVAFYENNGFKKIFSSVIADGANYYTLAYSPENKQLDGKFRKIEIKLLGSSNAGSTNAKDPKDATYHLSYRRGYFADPLQAQPTKVSAVVAGSSMVHNAPSSARLLFQARVLPADDPAVQSAAQTQQPEADSGGSLTRKLHGPLKRYSIDFLADMHRVSADLAEDGRRYSTLEFIAIAYDADGKMLNYSDRTFKRVIGPAKYGEFLQAGWPMHQELDLPAGDIYLRLGVRDITTGWLGSLEIPVKVANSN